MPTPLNDIPLYPEFRNSLHELKTEPPYFQDVKSGLKSFEVRENDRDYKLGDELLLKEYVPANVEKNKAGYYTGAICHRRISYILQGGQFGIKEGTVILGLEKI